MLSFFRSRKYISIIMILAAILIYQLFPEISSMQEEDDCTQAYRSTMSSEEVAELYGLPIVQVVILPDNVNPVPRIILAVDYFGEVANCGLEMQFVSNDETNRVVVSVKILASDAEISEDWLCVDFEPALANIPNGHRSYQSGCSAVIAHNGENIFVRLSSFESVDKTLEIANSIR